MINNENENVLIAEFMGWERNRYPHLPNILHKGIGVYEVHIHVDHLKYDTSWDWLMAVTDKINQLWDLNQIGTHAEAVLRLPISSHMQQVYKEVVVFIKWYNQQKPTI